MNLGLFLSLFGKSSSGGGGGTSPTLDINFLSGDTIPGGVTFSRASSATRVNSSGLVETVAIDVGRINYTLAGQSLGLLLESSATNFALYGRDLTSSAWTKAGCTTAKTATGVDGIVNSASTITATSANAIVRQGITASSSQRITSAYIRRRTGAGVVTFWQTGFGSNLVVNGDFATNVSGWTDASTAPATVTWSSGSALYNVPSGFAKLRQMITTVPGKLYEIKATGTVSILNVGTASGLGDLLGNDLAAQTRYFVAPTTTTWINTGTTTDGQTLDNVVVREVSETTVNLTGLWQLFSTTDATVVNPYIGFRIATSGDAIDVDYIQNETVPITSAIATTSATVDRVADTATIILPSNSDVLIQDRYGAEWRNGISAGTYTIAPRSGQTTVARLRAYSAGALSAGEKSALMVAA